MNRRDLITILLFVLWGLYVIFIIPTFAFAVSPKMLIAIFTFSMFILLVLYATFGILSFTIKRFREWCDKKIFKS